MNALDLRTFDDAVYPVELSRQAYKFWFFKKTSILLLSSQVLKEETIFILQGKKALIRLSSLELAISYAYYIAFLYDNKRQDNKRSS